MSIFYWPVCAAALMVAGGAFLLRLIPHRHKELRKISIGIINLGFALAMAVMVGAFVIFYMTPGR